MSFLSQLSSTGVQHQRRRDPTWFFFGFDIARWVLYEAVVEVAGKELGLVTFGFLGEESW